MCFVLVVCNLIGEEDEDEEEDNDEEEDTDEEEEEKEEAPPKKKAKQQKGSPFFALNPKELESPRRCTLLYTSVFT